MKSIDEGMMPDHVYESDGVRIFEHFGDGPLFRSDRDATDLISEAASVNAELTVVPVSRLAPEFFSLKTRIAGEFLQKFVTYGKRIAIVGEIPAQYSQSRALHDFIVECNRGHQIWFVNSLEDLANRLANPGNSSPSRR